MTQSVFEEGETVSDHDDGAADNDGRTDSVDLPAPIPAIWVTDGMQLYELDPENFAMDWANVLTLDGDLPNEEITDLAVDSAGRVFATSYDGIYRVNPDTGELKMIAEVRIGNSLSFLPAHTPGIDNEEEVLLGDSEGTLVLIDSPSGEVHYVLTIADAVGRNCEMSGDTATIPGRGTYITLACEDTPRIDLLGKIDFVSGRISVIGPIKTAALSANVEEEEGGFANLDTGAGASPEAAATTYRWVYGVSYFGGGLYGFTWKGPVIMIDPVDASAVEVLNDSDKVNFLGAGSPAVDVPVQ